MDETTLRADALWRAAVYASVGLLHLHENVLLSEPLTAAHTKPRPSGHWGTVPGTAWALGHIGLAAGDAAHGQRLVPLLGAGHAGVVQLAMAWLTGELGRVRSRFSRNREGLTRLCQAFPEVDGLGSEVTPHLLAGGFCGGRLGGALAFAQGAALAVPDHIVMPVIGDGECETPTTAAAWLAGNAIPTARVLPVVHVNGFRMGGRSLLGEMAEGQLKTYASGLGWHPLITEVTDGSLEEHRAFRHALREAVEMTASRRRCALFLCCPKGWGGPETMSGRRVLGTPRTHKTPLTNLWRDDEQLQLLREWLASYRPQELFDAEGQPTGALARALDAARWHRLPSERPESERKAEATPGQGRFISFAEAVTTTVGAHSAAGGFRVFSPDELGSNRLGQLVDMEWSTEVLAEEVLLEWLAGWTAARRRGVLISYEAFAPLFTSGLVAHLKQRRLQAKLPVPSLNLVLTSYGWHNVYSHGDPSLATTLLALGDPAVHVLVPADATRTARALDVALHSEGQVNVVVAGKHITADQPAHTIEKEVTRGLAVWPDLSGDAEPDLTVVVAGDLPAETARRAIDGLAAADRKRVRTVGVLDLTVLGDPQIWPRGLADPDLRHYLGDHASLLVLTLGHPAAVWGLLGARLRDRHVEVTGWREPPGPMPQKELAASLGLDADGVGRAMRTLLAERRRSA
ncbi:hypothetical protein [Streptomyces aidingensis]|uniref:Xylulose-5-phosphate/fructose-6-phosphate phosphoketolase n=1 Tax=Streptomyces aidingensis TaxID=910347 RepID=A0A1I1KM66_9ACTN|nr:hypothetical protein [Streptomyces aidingensis]SFC61966.1 xylulose-5-phosphate/fructose-6-phosphate phosphoketolase [Streptomyces aidingensis]